MTIAQQIISGLHTYALTNGVLKLVVIPQLGGKIISLCRIDSGNEWLLPRSHPAQPLTIPSYGANFEQHGVSGFDECFPTVGPCLYPREQRPPLLIPDHGELWSSRWEVSRPGSDPFVVTARGRALPYVFSRSVSLHDSTARFDYLLENTGPSTFQYLWSAHPLLRVMEGDQIILPENVTEMRVEHSRSNRLGTGGTSCGWPIAKTSTGTVQLSTVHHSNSGSAEKLFTPPLRAGSCALRSAGRSETLAFSFDPAEVPYLGLWINEGGSPAGSSEKDFTVALEPCLAPYDSLAEAIHAGRAPSIRPNETRSWRMEMTVTRLPELAA